MRMTPGKSKGGSAPYRSPLHGPPAGAPREREWLRYQVQGHHPGRYWEQVAEHSDLNRALLDALKRARIGKVAYRVWDRMERKEIWRGYGHGATVEAWTKARPPGLIGQNRRAAMNKSAKRWLYVEDHQKRHIGKTFGFPDAMARELRKKGLYFTATPGGNYVLFHVHGKTSRRNTANPVLSHKMLALRPGTMRLGDAMRYGRALLEAGYVIRLWDGSGWEVVIHPNDSMGTSSGKGPGGGRAYLAHGAGMVKTWPITMIAYQGQRGLGWQTPASVRRLLSKGRVSANSGEQVSPTFHIMHVSVDGAGIHTRNITLKRKAIALAQKLQAKSDKGGNPWGYHYIVYRTYPHSAHFAGRSDAIYRTKSRAASNPRQTYEVVVGNIGTVYSGPSVKEARRKYSAYVAQSKTGRGRAGGESVALMAGGEIVREHAGTHQENRRRRASAKRRSDDNPRDAHNAIVGAFLAGKSKRFGTSTQTPGTRYMTDGRELRVWGHLVAEKVPGGIKLYDAGYQTLLTKNVLNTILDALGQPRISQTKFQWYIGSKEWTGEAVIPTGASQNRHRRARRAVSRNRGGRWYYGHKKGGGVEKFWSAKKPTEKSHGHRYLLVTGPFKGTKAMDTIFGFHWHGGPHTIVRRGKVSAVPNAKRLLGKRGYRKAMKFA